MPGAMRYNRFVRAAAGAPRLSLRGKGNSYCMIRSVIFDMDGLLIDSECLSVSGWRQAFREAGLPFSEQLIASCRGTGREDMRRRFEAYFAGRAADFDALLRRKNELADQVTAREGVHPKVGALTLLGWLRDQGYAVALATSTGEAVASEKLRGIGFYDYFDHYVYGSMITRYKPAPDIFLRAIELLDCPPQKCLVLEDSPNGIRAAHAAGAKPMMIPDLTQPDEELKRLLWAQGTTLLDVIPLLEDDRAGEGAAL